MENTNSLVMVMKNQAVTTSRIVAEYFGKNHFHIIRDIDALIAQMTSVQENTKLDSSKSTNPKLVDLQRGIKKNRH